MNIKSFGGYDHNYVLVKRLEYNSNMGILKIKIDNPRSRKEITKVLRYHQIKYFKYASSTELNGNEYSTHLWIKMYRRVLRYIHKYECYPDIDSDNPKIRSMGCWINLQLSPKLRLREYKKVLLNLLPGWMQYKEGNIIVFTWKKMLNLCVQFSRINERFPHKNNGNFDYLEHKLAIWLNNQKSKIMRGTCLEYINDFVKYIDEYDRMLVIDMQKKNKHIAKTWKIPKWDM